MLRRLAVTAQRGELAAPHLRGGHADQRTHTRECRSTSAYPQPPNVEPIRLHDVQAVPDASPGQAGPQGHLAVASCPGAKIGVLGLNGSGKSTLLRIMAGQDTEYRGEAQLAPGATVGLLEQEPHLDETKDVRGNVEDGVAETRALLDRFNELAANYSDETADEFARMQERIDAVDAWNLDTQLDTAMDALRLPPVRRRRDDALRRRAPPRRALPAAARRARPAAARRADEPPRRRVRRLARAPPRGVRGHRRGRHPRSLLPRQRRGLDPRARPRPRHPLPGQLLELAGAEAGPARAGGEAGLLAQAHDRRRARVGAREPEGPAQEVQGAPEQLRARCSPRTATSSSTRSRSTSRRARAWAAR